MSNDTAVLFVHGIQGSPKWFRFLERSLPRDVDVRNLLLPGHGGSVRDFRRCGKTAWSRCVLDTAQDLTRNYNRVVYVGHSMGCLLGLTTAFQLDIPFGGMLLLCCPFRIHPTQAYVSENIRAVRSQGISDDPHVRYAWEVNGVKAESPVSYLPCVRPYLGLMRLIRLCNRMQPRVLPDTAFYYAAEDEIVSLRSVKVARNFTDEEVHLMHDCSHNYLEPKAQTELIDRLHGML